MRLGLSSIVGSIILAAFSVSLPTSTAAVELEEFPFALICEAPNNVVFVGYLFRVNPDGSAVYGTVLGDRFAVVDANGVISVSELAAGGGLCDNRTIDELRAAGLTREFSQ